MPNMPSPMNGVVAALVVATAGGLAGCASVPDKERLLLPGPGGEVAAISRPCGSAGTGAEPARLEASAAAGAEALAAAPLRVLSWNLHKGEDEGWQADLARFADEHDLLLLQEAVMTTPLRAVLEKSGHAWMMAGAFALGGTERGVLIAARARALGGCTLRSYEPLFPLPKSAIVTRYRVAGLDKPLAVANLHGINFTLGLGRFREQLEAVATELAREDGPLILAGDFNTWSLDRHQVLIEVAQRLRMQAIDPKPDGRRRTFGMHLDHLFVRGLRAVHAQAPEVKSSDHNPIMVRLAAP